MNLTLLPPSAVDKRRCKWECEERVRKIERVCVRERAAREIQKVWEKKKLNVRKIRRERFKRECEARANEWEKDRLIVKKKKIWIKNLSGREIAD